MTKVKFARFVFNGVDTKVVSRSTKIKGEDGTTRMTTEGGDGGEGEGGEGGEGVKKSSSDGGRGRGSGTVDVALVASQSSMSTPRGAKMESPASDEAGVGGDDDADSGVGASGGGEGALGQCSPGDDLDALSRRLEGAAAVRAGAGGLEVPGGGGGGGGHVAE